MAAVDDAGAAEDDAAADGVDESAMARRMNSIINRLVINEINR